MLISQRHGRLFNDQRCSRDLSTLRTDIMTGAPSRRNYPGLDLATPYHSGHVSLLSATDRRCALRPMHGRNPRVINRGLQTRIGTHAPANESRGKAPLKFDKRHHVSPKRRLIHAAAGHSRAIFFASRNCCLTLSAFEQVPADPTELAGQLFY